MNEQMQKQFHKRQYPLVRYLGLLLAVALLFTGVTFARYATNSGIAASIGIAAFDVDYTIEGVNSTTFGNMDYWQSSGGTWLEQGAGSARTVRIQFKNNGGVAVQPTLRLSGPAIFWENIALQIAQGTTAESGSNEQIDASSAFAGESISTQYVFADLIKKRVEGSGTTLKGETHNYEYEGYRSWNGEEFDTINSDQFGQRESSDHGMIGEKLQMEGGFRLSADGTKFEKDTLTATRTEKYYKDTDGTITEVPKGERYPMTMTIKAEMRTEKYSIGYSRRDSSGGLPALYLDCQKSMPYYTIEIKADRLVLKPGETKTVILFMTWTNSVAPAELTDDVKVYGGKMEGLLKTGGYLDNSKSIEVLGYHFNQNGVPECDENGNAIVENGVPVTTTVRVTNTFASPGTEGTAVTATYEHIATLAGEDSPFPHPMEQQPDDDNIYGCSNADPAYVDISKIKSTIDPSTIAMAMSDDGTSLDYTVATEIGYTTDFRVVLEQASEAPAAQQP